MTKIEWIKQFHRTKDKFRWFIDEYFPGMFEMIEMYANNENVRGCKLIMDDIWFDLPDSKFNIMENPKGWNEFLNLLETEITD